MLSFDFTDTDAPDQVADTSTDTLLFRPDPERHVDLRPRAHAQEGSLRGPHDAAPPSPHPGDAPGS